MPSTAPQTTRRRRRRDRQRHLAHPLLTSKSPQAKRIQQQVTARSTAAGSPFKPNIAHGVTDGT